MARRAKTLPPPRRERMLKRARAMAHLASWQRTHLDDSQTAKTPCPPEALTERGFSPAMAAELTRGPRPWCKVPNLDGRPAGEYTRHRALPLIECLDSGAEP
jgi:hypothetical protein